MGADNALFIFDAEFFESFDGWAHHLKVAGGPHNDTDFHSHKGSIFSEYCEKTINFADRFFNTQ